MSAHLHRFGTFLTLFVVVVVLAGHPAARAAEPTLDEGWQSSGPIEPQSLAADAQGAVALGRTGEVVVVDAAGLERWRRTIVADVDFGPVAIGADLVVVTVDDEGLIAFERASSEGRWEHLAAGARDVAVGATSDGTSAVAVVSDLGVLELVDGATGTVRWTAAFPIADAIIAARTWVVGERVVLFWTDDAGAHVRAFTSDGGSESWGSDFPESSSMAAVSDESVTIAENLRIDRRERVVTEIRHLAVLDGSELWARRSRSRSPYSSGLETVAAPQGIALVDLAGKVTVLDPSTGKVRWKMATGLVQFEAEPHVVGEVFAMTTYGTGIMLANMADGDAISTDALDPTQTAATIEASAAAGDHLYLLVSRLWGDPEIWMLQAGPA
ncbi:MAG: PQQ-binding-like beta-propeller repeat protein [Acidimicrobiia bacterium]